MPPFFSIFYRTVASHGFPDSGKVSIMTEMKAAVSCSSSGERNNRSEFISKSLSLSVSHPCCEQFCMRAKTHAKTHACRIAWHQTIHAWKKHASKKACGQYTTVFSKELESEKTCGRKPPSVWLFFLEANDWFRWKWWSIGFFPPPLSPKWNISASVSIRHVHSP